MRTIDVALRIRADGEGLQVEIQALGARVAAPFALPPAAWRDLVGLPVELKEAVRGLMAVNDFLVGEERESPERLGGQLFEALFPDRVRSVLDQVRGSGHPLHLRLVWDAEDERLAALHRLPWELMRVPETADVLVLEPRLSFARHLDVAVLQPALPPPETLRIVVVAANPRDSPRLSLDRELSGLQMLDEADSALTVIPAPRRAGLLAIRRLLETHRAHILHFMGHGEIGPDGAGRLLFEDAGGWQQPITGDDLARTLQGLDDLRLVVLNACRTAETRARPFDSVATRLVQGGLPAVIAMQAPIPDDMAIAFSHELYPSLARGRVLERAVCAARHAIHALAPGGIAWAVPVLFTNMTGKTLGGLDEDELPADEQVVRARYLAWMIEHHGELEIPWLPDGGRRPRLPLSGIYYLFRRDHEPPSERPRPRRLQAHPASLSRLLDSHDLSPEEEHILVWRQLRRLARGRDAIAARSTQRDEDDGAGVCSFDEILTRHHRIVLLGEPGSGKTSLLRWLARRSAESMRDGDGQFLVDGQEVDPRRVDDARIDLGPARLPIFLDLAAYARHRRQRGGLRLAEYMGRHLGVDLDTPAADATGGAIEPEVLRLILIRELRRGNALLLGDGLDQILDVEERLAIVQEIEVFLSALGCPAVITSRSIGYAQAPLAAPAVCFELEPLVGRGLEQLCRRWAEVLPVSAESLSAGVATLRRRGAGDLVASPLFITVLAAILQRGGGHLPVRRLDLYAPAITILLDRWRELAPIGGGFSRPLLTLLAALAAETHDRPESFGLIEHRRLSAWLAAHCERGEAALLEGLLHRDIGPLVPYGASIFGFLHRALQEYLAACWLAAEPEHAEERLCQRLEDPTWRVPSAMALGLLAETFDDEAMTALLHRLLATDADEPRQLIPRAAFLILEALTELPPDIDLPIAELAAILLDRAVADDGGSLGTTIESALASLLAGPYLHITDRALVHLLRASPQTLTLPLGRIAHAAPEVPPRLAAEVGEKLAHDQPPWWIDRALSCLYTRDLSLLPHGSAARTLRLDPLIAAQVAGDLHWRRLVHAVYGDGSRPYRVSPLDDEFLTALVAGRDTNSLKPRLRSLAEGERSEAARHARLTLLILGELPPLVDEHAHTTLVLDLDRGSSAVVTASRSANWIRPLLDAHRQLADATWLRLVRTLGGRLEATQRVELLLCLAAEVSEALRAPLLGSLWRELLLIEQNREGERGDFDPIHRVAVLLDRHGAFLTSPIDAFVNSWLAAGRLTFELPPATERPTAMHLAAVLDVLAGIPAPFDFVRAWALFVLHDELAAHDLLTEALLLAEVSLSDRLGARALARSRHLMAEAPLARQALLEHAYALSDPWQRYRALRRLAASLAELRQPLLADRIATNRILLSPVTMAMHGIVDPVRRCWPLASLHLEPEAFRLGETEAGRLIATLSRLGFTIADSDPLILGVLADIVRSLSPKHSTADPSPAPSPHDPLIRAEAGELDCTILDGLLERIENGDDHERLRSALALHGDRTVLRRRWPISRIGGDVVFRLAEHWLRRRREAPQTALVLRWTFEALEHDTPDLLQRAAETRGAEAEVAEIILRFVETVAMDALPFLGEILRHGARRARQAMVRGLPNLLAAQSHRAAAVWSAVEPFLPAAAEAFGEQWVQLGGPNAVVDAVQRALTEDGGTARAIELYAASAIPWAELLTRQPREIRAALHHLGQRRRVGECRGQQAAAAAERVAARPLLLPLLLDWLEQRLRSALTRDTDDHTTRDLLEIIATVAQRLPRTYFEASDERPHWSRLLSEAVVYADWLSARRAAVELLGMSRRLGDLELRALFAALLDAPEVQRTALDSLACYRRLDAPNALDPIAEALSADRPSYVFAAARLLTAIARPPHCEPELRRRIEGMLTAVAAVPDSRRQVYVFDYTTAPQNRFVKIATIGRLDRLIRGLLLDIQGRPDFIMTKPVECAP